MNTFWDMHLFVYSPLAWVSLLAVLLLVGWRRLSRRWRIAGVLLELALLVLCTPLGANALVRYVESGTPAETRCRVDANGPIVLLAGGFERPPRDVDDYAAFTSESWTRLRGAVALWKRSGGIMLIAGGGEHAIKESVMLARLAEEWGVPAQALRTETRSTNTWDSAFALQDILPTRIRLVSSAWHLPRALIAFRAADFQACTYASDSDYQPTHGWDALLPRAWASEKAEMPIYELLGNGYYRLRAGALRTRR